MVPEWQKAYMNYNLLKTLLKEIPKFMQKTKPPSGQTDVRGALSRKLTLYRTFSGLTKSQTSYNPISPSGPDIESQKAILVNPVSHHDHERSESYKTTFLLASDSGGEYELVYFRRLDDEFKKVNEFYKGKVEEVLNEAETLNKQMDALIAFRIKVENPTGWSHEDRSGEMTSLASDVAASAAALHATTPSGARGNRISPSMDVINEGSLGHEHSSDGLNHADKEEEEEEQQQQQHQQEMKKNMINRVRRPAPLQVLHKVQMNNAKETPRSTIKGFLQIPDHTELKFTRENLRRVEEQLKRVFVEFYQKLRLLKSYSFLNVLAFSNSSNQNSKRAISTQLLIKISS